MILRWLVRIHVAVTVLGPRCLLPLLAHLSPLLNKAGRHPGRETSLRLDLLITLLDGGL